MNEIREYLDSLGKSRFDRWFSQLDFAASARVRVSLDRMANGNLSNVEGVGRGVFEYKIHFGPGYRIYFGKDGERIIVLLAGGTKKRQQVDIAEAQIAWADYKQRKITKVRYGSH